MAALETRGGAAQAAEVLKRLTLMSAGRGEAVLTANYANAPLESCWLGLQPREGFNLSRVVVSAEEGVRGWKEPPARRFRLLPPTPPSRSVCR